MGVSRHRNAHALDGHFGSNTRIITDPGPSHPTVNVNEGSMPLGEFMCSPEWAMHGGSKGGLAGSSRCWARSSSLLLCCSDIT